MKTSLRQQREIVQAIKDEPNYVRGVKMLREWLGNNGYEGSQDCQHYAVIRSTGKCMACGIIPQ
jgi:hypothetical protein